METSANDAVLTHQILLGDFPPISAELCRYGALLATTCESYPNVVVRLLAGIVVGGFGIFLIGLAGVVFVKPACAERFFKSFASSARAHYTEQAVRLLIGASIVAYSPVMWQANLFQLVGWVIVVTTVGLLFTPWRWHHRFGQWAIPLVLRNMRLYAMGLFAFGAFLLYGVYAGPQGSP
jgi:hypothetical protein